PAAAWSGRAAARGPDGVRGPGAAGAASALRALPVPACARAASAQVSGTAALPAADVGLVPAWAWGRWRADPAARGPVAAGPPFRALRPDVAAAAARPGAVQRAAAEARAAPAPAAAVVEREAAACPGARLR